MRPDLVWRLGDSDFERRFKGIAGFPAHSDSLYAIGVSQKNGTALKCSFHLLQEYCTDDDIPKRTSAEGPSCEWEEYEQTGEYIGKIDEIIQVRLAIS